MKRRTNKGRRRASGSHRTFRGVDMARFIAAQFYSAFGSDPLPNCSEYRIEYESERLKRRYQAALVSAAKKLSREELRVLANIADGIDDDGSTLRQEIGECE